MHVGKFQLDFYQLFVMVDGVFRQAANVLDFAFDLIFNIFQSVFECDHLGLDFVDRRTSAVF